MNNQYAKISFLASGHVIQDILITTADISPKRLTEMLNSGSAITTVQEDGKVCVTTGDWEEIAEIFYVENELEFGDFCLEDEYELPAPQKPEPFDASFLARSCAVGDFIYEDEGDLSVKEIMEVLEEAGDVEPVGLYLEENALGMTGNQLLREIDMAERGMLNIMRLAYNAAKNGQELI